MNIKEKKVYYCDHCKKHGLSRVAMEKHERHCTMNPLRVCRWRGVDEHSDFYLPWVVKMLQARQPFDNEAIPWLREQVGECPACMLAALRQSAIDFHRWTQWDYEAEVKQWREDQRKAEDYEEFRRIESSWA